MQKAWINVLQAQWGSNEFSRRYSEVASLLTDTIEQLYALPERSCERSLRYAFSWWQALIQPKANWSASNHPPSSIIDDAALDHLEAAADIIAGSLSATSAAPAGENLEGLATQCKFWIRLIEEIDDVELSGSIKSELVAQLRHVLWLIENVDLFGGARVARETNRAMGSIAQASTSLDNASPETVGRWKKAWFALLAACMFFTTGATMFQDALTAGEGIVKEIGGVVDQIQGEDGQKNASP
ncbi:hypothetical protein GCM10023085_39050 [Actinomadura viridis]